MNVSIDKIIHGSQEDVINSLYNDIEQNNKRVLITANSETFVFAEENEVMKQLLQKEETKIVVDGIAAYKGLKHLGLKDFTKVPGVDIVQILLEYCNEHNLKVAVFGGKQESIDFFKRYLKEELPNLSLVGVSNGYIQDKVGVLKSFSEAKPDLVLVAMGIPLQEILINECLEDFNKGIFIGCGGSIDVIGGFKKRAPKFFTASNTEWAYRIIKEPKRFMRFINTNIKFFKLIRTSKR